VAGLCADVAALRAENAALRSSLAAVTSQLTALTHHVEAVGYDATQLVPIGMTDAALFPDDAFVASSCFSPAKGAAKSRMSTRMGLFAPQRGCTAGEWVQVRLPLLPHPVPHRRGRHLAGGAVASAAGGAGASDSADGRALSTLGVAAAAAASEGAAAASSLVSVYGACTAGYGGGETMTYCWRAVAFQVSPRRGTRWR
jgi:hypothetical protein